MPGAKSEGTLDINEMKLLKEEGNLKVGSKISVLVVKLEDKKGDLIISREKAKKMGITERKKALKQFNEKRIIEKQLKIIDNFFNSYEKYTNS